MVQNLATAATIATITGAVVKGIFHVLSKLYFDKDQELRQRLNHYFDFVFSHKTLDIGKAVSRKLYMTASNLLRGQNGISIFLGFLFVLNCVVMYVGHPFNKAIPNDLRSIFLDIDPASLRHLFPTPLDAYGVQIHFSILRFLMGALSLTLLGAYSFLFSFSMLMLASNSKAGGSHLLTFIWNIAAIVSVIWAIVKCTYFWYYPDFVFSLIGSVVEISAYGSVLWVASKLLSVTDNRIAPFAGLLRLWTVPIRLDS